METPPISRKVVAAPVHAPDDSHPHRGASQGAPDSDASSSDESVIRTPKAVAIYPGEGKSPTRFVSPQIKRLKRRADDGGSIGGCGGSTAESAVPDRNRCFQLLKSRGVEFVGPIGQPRSPLALSMVPASPITSPRSPGGSKTMRGTLVRSHGVLDLKSPRRTPCPSGSKTVRLGPATPVGSTTSRLPVLPEPRGQGRMRAARSAGDLRATSKLSDMHSKSQGKLKKSPLRPVVPMRTDPPLAFSSPEEFETRLAQTLEKELFPLVSAKSDAGARNAACQLFRNNALPGQKFLADLRRTPEMVNFARQFIDRLDRLPLLRPAAVAAHYAPCTGFVDIRDFAGGIDAPCMKAHFAPSLESVVDVLRKSRLPPAAVSTVAAMGEAIQKACTTNRRLRTEAGDEFHGVDKHAESEFVTIATKAVVILGIVAPEFRCWSDRELTASDQRRCTVARLIGYVLMKLGTGNQIEPDYFAPKSQAYLNGKLEPLAAELPGIVAAISGSVQTAAESSPEESLA